MAGILIEYARFVEVRQRRARIGAALRQPNETPPPPTRRAPLDDAVEPDELARTVVEVKVTHRPVDVR